MSRVPPSKSAASRRADFERRSPLFLFLGLLVLASVAVYRVRVHAIIAGVSPELLFGVGSKAYLAVRRSSDALASAFVLTILASLWLIADSAGRIFGRVVAAMALVIAVASSLFLVVAVDFMRVYQTAFSKSFVGGEHFTGVKSMLMSAAAEFSAESRFLAAAVIVLAAALATAAGRMASAARFRFAQAANAALSITASLALIVLAASGKIDAARLGPVGFEPGPASQGAELGTNPLVAVAFGPERATFVPPDVPESAQAFYNTDSLEHPDADRPLVEALKGSHNVILYIFESTSWAYFGLDLGGRPVMPAMRSLASRGLLLKRHYANYPLSANTLYSLLSSRYSMYGKAMIFHEYYDVDVDSLPEVLHRAGYATSFIHTGDLLYASRDKFLSDRGIDRMILQRDLQRDPRFRKNVGWGADEFSMIDPAVEWIRALAGRPYLLMMSPVSPHHPYAAPEGFERVADPDEEGISDLERVFRNYLNSLHYADAALGRLVEALEREGLMENTVLVVVTDHGEAFRQHRGNYNHPLFVYEENVHVPALFYGPGIIPEGIELDSVTRHIDIMPSILDLLRVEDSARRDGESIFSRSREKMAVFHTSWTDEYMGVRDGKWKYILRVKDSVETLYDLEADPGERIDVAADFPAVAERYRGVADSMIAYMIDQYRDVPRIPGYSLPKRE